jgi:putative transposase
VTVPKHVRRLEGLGANVISLYAKHLAEIYGTEVSRETVSKITDEIVGDMLAWQNRPLDRVYPVLLIDAIVIKVRDSQVANRPVYVAIGVNDWWGPESQSTSGPRRASTGSSPRRSASM